MKFTIEVSNPFHAGWVTAHLGQPPKAPEGLDAAGLLQFKHGYRTYQESLRGMPSVSRMAENFLEFVEDSAITIQRHDEPTNSTSATNIIPISPAPQQ